MPTPRRFPDRTLSAAERAALSRARRAAERRRYVEALRQIAAARTLAAAQSAALAALETPRPDATAVQTVAE